MPSEQVPRTQSAGPASKSGRAENFLQTENFGGLNVQSSELNVPLEDSPNLVNIKVDINGNLRKRDGSVYRGSLDNPAGISLVPYSIKTGEKLIIAKEGKRININMLPKKDTIGEVTQIDLKSNVWSDSAESIRADWVVTNESTPRVIWVCSINAPIQLQIIEQTVTLTGASTFDVTDTRFTNVAFGSAFLIHDNTKYDLSAKSGTDPNFTFTISSGTPTGTGTLIAFAWQWWAEAMALTGDMTYDSSVRINVTTTTDRNVAIPSNLLRNVVSDGLLLQAVGGVIGRLPMLLFQDNLQTATAFGVSSTLLPTGASQFSFSYGQNTQSNNNYITPGSTHVTFGAIGAGDPTPVHFTRVYGMNFNGSEVSAAGQDLVVYVDDGEWTQNTGVTRGAYDPGNNEYWLTLDVPFGGPESNPATPAKWLRAGDCNYPFGFPNFHTMRVVNVGNSGFVGSSALTDLANKTANTYKDAYAIGAYGLQYFANYSGTGGFPTSIAIFQNRLCLSGFPNFPNTVLFSSTSDNKIPGESFTDFQIALGDGLADSAFDRTIDAKSDQKIVAVESWQGQLFAFTQDSVVRLWGGDVNIDVSPTNCFTSTIARQGAKNPESVVVTDTSVLYLGRNGVYAIVSTDQTGGYTIQNVGLKIRPIIEDTDKFNDSSAWMVWDERNSELYLALADVNQVFVAIRLFVLNVARSAWTEYTTTNGYFFSVHGIAIDERMVVAYNAFGNYNDSGTAPTDSALLMEMNLPYNYDLVEEKTATDPITYSQSRWFKITYTTKSEQRRYEVNVEKANAAYSFRMLPLAEIEDITVTIDGVAQTFGTDFVKTPDGTAIFITKTSITDGVPLIITQKNQDKLHPVSVVLDKVPLVEVTDYTVSESSNQIAVNFVSTPDASAKVIFGMQLPAYYFSPFFIRQTIGEDKRVQQFFGYFRNERYDITWGHDDANVAASQDPESISDKYRQLVDFNVMIIYNSTTYGDSVTDIYTKDDGIYETGDLNGIESPNSRFYRHTRFAVPVYGHAYGFQVVVWNFDNNTFEMVGYQLKTRQLGKQSTSRRFNI